jgi:Domain of unknown function (DUF4062)
VRNRPKVFISSVSHEFMTLRDNLRADLAAYYEPFLSESAHESGQPDLVLIQKIADADVFFCLVGYERGSEMSGDKGGRSIVEWELETAQARKSRGLIKWLVVPGLFVYILKCSTEIPIDPRQIAFRDRVSGIHSTWRLLCESHHDLLRAVRNGLEQWHNRQRGRERWALQAMLLITSVEVVGFVTASRLIEGVPPSAIGLFLFGVAFLIAQSFVVLYNANWGPPS